MKKSESGSPGRLVKPALAKETLKSHPRQRVHPFESGKHPEACVLEIVTLLPPETGDAPLLPMPDFKRVRFGCFQPDAQEVSVEGSFNNWNPRATAMKRDPRGDWSVEVQLPPGEYRYRFLVDGEWRDDPAALFTAMNSYGSFDAVVIV